MANLPETSEFTAGVYQLEITDPVEGGELGISNAQAKALANRTKWLKDQITAINRFIPKKVGLFTGFNIANSPVGALTSSGDITASVATVFGDDLTTVTVTMDSPMPNTNYLPKIYLQAFESSSPYVAQFQISQPIYVINSASVFTIIFSKENPNNTDLTVRLEIYSLD